MKLTQLVQNVLCAHSMIVDFNSEGGSVTLLIEPFGSKIIKRFDHTFVDNFEPNLALGLEAVCNKFLELEKAANGLAIGPNLRWEI